MNQSEDKYIMPNPNEVITLTDLSGIPKNGIFWFKDGAIRIEIGIGVLDNRRLINLDDKKT